MTETQKYKEIFIFVSGSTPQIITETIYALAVKKPAIYPDEIIVITTIDGAKVAKESLEKKGILKNLCEDYKTPYIEISYKIPLDKSGVPLQDIRTTDDNKAMADLINNIIQEKTKDKNNRLHCSIAGGRKTMSFYLGSALQLYGRTQDKLYHVLVTPEFESNRDFFYKPLKNQKIKTLDGRELNTDDAEITLAELPFVRLGDKAKISGSSYDESVKAGQDAIDSAVIPLDVSVDLSERNLIIGSNKIKMQPMQLALYATILKLKKECKKSKCENCDECSIKRVEWSERNVGVFEAIYKNLRQLNDIKWILKKDGRFLISDETLTQIISKINSILIKNIGNNPLSRYYLINSVGTYGNTHYVINLDKKKIKEID